MVAGRAELGLVALGRTLFEPEFVGRVVVGRTLVGRVFDELPGRTVFLVSVLPDGRTVFGVFVREVVPLEIVPVWVRPAAELRPATGSLPIVPLPSDTSPAFRVPSVLRTPWLFSREAMRPSMDLATALLETRVALLEERTFVWSREFDRTIMSLRIPPP